MDRNKLNRVLKSIEEQNFTNDYLRFYNYFLDGCVVLNIYAKDIIIVSENK